MFKVEVNDSLVRCIHCGREEQVTFIYCLKNGWPKCCGYTMRLIETKANIEGNVALLCADAEAQAMLELQACTQEANKE